MPRKRKGPPNDSIDSILLAMSRREDIDPATLEHYFRRLDEEWTKGARTKVLNLFRSQDPMAHTAAFRILAELATDFDREELEDVVADPTISDMAKLTLAPLLKELHSEMADDGIIDYLNDPESAMQQMQLRLLDLIGQSELGVESVLEDVLSMPVERRLGFVNWLGNSQDARAANLLLPLLENSTTKVVEATIDALEQLGSIAVQQTIPALNYFIATTSNRQLKQHARTVLGRLTMQSALGAEEAAMEEVGTYHLPLHEVRVSFIDGVGAQMIMFSWHRPDGLLKGVNILYQEQWGIKDCYGTDEMDASRWDHLVAEMNEQGFGSVQVPLEYGRALVAEARATNKKTRRKLPIAYSIWRPFIEGDEPLKKSSPAVLTRLEPLTWSESVEALALRGGELYGVNEFMSWLFEPLERLVPYIDRFWSRNIFDSPSASLRRRGRKKGQKKESQEEVESIVTDAIQDLIDPHWRTTYEARLRKQAALFQFAHRTEHIELIRAVAAALHPDSPLPVTQQPFVRMMLRLSIENGPFRAMIAALESGQLGPITPDLLVDDEQEAPVMLNPFARGVPVRNHVNHERESDGPPPIDLFPDDEE